MSKALSNIDLSSIKASRIEMQVGEIPVYVLRKKIKNLHLRVLRPDGRVQVSVPIHLRDKLIQQFVVSRLDWIKQAQRRIALQPPQPKNEMVSGEIHFVFGERYLLEVVERTGKHEILIKDAKTLCLYISPNTRLQNRQKVLSEWYRDQLKEKIPVLLEQWLPKIDKPLHDWGVKRMKTRWGSCNISKKRIWLSLELAKKPAECLEYVLVHELVHLLERKHNQRFKNLMDIFLPNWRDRQILLQNAPSAQFLGTL